MTGISQLAERCGLFFEKSGLPQYRN